MGIIKNEEFNSIVSAIRNDKQLEEAIDIVCCMTFLEENIELSEYNKEYNCKSNLNGHVFADDGCGGVYILLEDNSIGHIGYSQSESGRVANNLNELLELELNLAFSWHNYGLQFQKLTKELVKSYEIEGREQFEDAFGEDYDENKDFIAKKLNLKLSNNLLDEVITKMYKLAKSEPLFETTQSFDDEVIHFKNIVK